MGGRGGSDDRLSSAGANHGSGVENPTDGPGLYAANCVACDPATLARDLPTFIAHGFEIRDVTPFDDFDGTLPNFVLPVGTTPPTRCRTGWQFEHMRVLDDTPDTFNNVRVLQ